MLWLATVGLLVLSCGEAGKDKKGVNDPCENSTDCADSTGHYGVCMSTGPGELGSPCGGPGECKSFVCTNGVCGPGTRADGELCLPVAECAGGICEDNICSSDVQPDGAVLDAGPDSAPPADMTLDAAIGHAT